MVYIGTKGYETSDTSVAAVSKTHPEDLQGWGGARGCGLKYDGFTPKRKGREPGDRYRRGGLEGLRNGG